MIDLLSLWVSGAILEPDWLPPETAAWARRHLAVLEAIYDSFDRTGEWPDPVELQRTVRAAGMRLPLARIVTQMPPELGQRWYGPDRVVLSLFGVACCPAARTLVDAYFATLQLALVRHDSPALANRLTREDVVVNLGLDQTQADRLSTLILADCPFLGSGDSGLHSWDREIDERVVEYDHASTADEFLELVALQRWPQRFRLGAERAVHEPVPPQPSEAPGPSSSAARAAEPIVSPLTASLLVLGLGANLLAVVLAPLPFAAAVIGATAAASIVFWRWPRLHVSIATTAVALAAAAAAGGAALVSDNEGGDETRPISQQLDEVVRRAAQERRYVVLRRERSLHGTGTKSYLMVLRDEALRDRFRTDLGTPSAISDEVRIYDDVDGELRLRFRFQAQGPGEIVQRPEGDMPSFIFRLRTIDDFDRNGESEVVGLFERNTLASGPLPVPVIITWDEGDARYRIHSLVPEAPRLQPPKDIDPVVLEGYTKPTELHNQHAQHLLLGYAVDEFAVVTTKRAPVVIAAYAEQTSQGFGGRYELKGWFMDLQAPTPDFYVCGPTRRGGLVVRPESPADLHDKMRERLAGDPNACGDG